MSGEQDTKKPNLRQRLAKEWRRLRIRLACAILPGDIELNVDPTHIFRMKLVENAGRVKALAGVDGRVLPPAGDRVRPVGVVTIPSEKLVDPHYEETVRRTKEEFERLTKAAPQSVGDPLIEGLVAKKETVQKLAAIGEQRDMKLSYRPFSRVEHETTEGNKAFDAKAVTEAVAETAKEMPQLPEAEANVFYGAGVPKSVIADIAAYKDRFKK